MRPVIRPGRVNKNNEERIIALIKYCNLGQMEKEPEIYWNKGNFPLSVLKK